MGGGDVQGCTGKSSFLVTFAQHSQVIRLLIHGILWAVSLNTDRKVTIDLSLVGLDLIDGKKDSIAELAKCCEDDNLDLKKIIGILSSSLDAIQWRAALQLLEYAAEYDQKNFTTYMPATFKAVGALLSSDDLMVLWGALHVMKFFFLNGYDEYDEEDKLVLCSLPLHLQSREPTVQRASVGVLDAVARSNSNSVQIAVLEELTDRASQPRLKPRRISHMSYPF